MAIHKTLKVYARIGFSDVIVPVEEAEDNDKPLVGEDTYLVGYEDEEGNECERDGTYLEQKYKAK